MSYVSRGDFDKPAPAAAVPKPADLALEAKFLQQSQDVRTGLVDRHYRIDG